MSLVENPFRVGLARDAAPEACLLVLFGATGDLTARKLMPALWQLWLNGLAPKEWAIVGVARRPKSHEEWQADMRAAIGKYARTEPSSEDEWAAFAARLRYVSVEFNQPEAYQALATALTSFEGELGTGGNRLYYLAVAPEFFAPIATSLHTSGQIGTDESAGFRRLVLEKPFGTDQASAQALADQLHHLVDEDQIYRIDHYLGKETVQNLLTLRFGNAIFEPLWNRRYIDHVQITVAESDGMGRRGEFYDQTGALRDMVQNHMMQLLAIVAMEPPATWEANAVRDEKAKVMRALPTWNAEQVQANSVRAQYTAGVGATEELPGYLQEGGVQQDSTTETYVALRLGLDTWRWSGVPFYLRHGKRLPKRATEIAIAFRQPPLTLFPDVVGRMGNSLIIRIQPDEGISLNFAAKMPGSKLTLQAVKMDFAYGQSFAQSSPEAYERLLLDAVLGDNTLFTRLDEVLSAWRFVDAVRAGWDAQPNEPLASYVAGTWGPDEADALLPSGGEWRRL